MMKLMTMKQYMKMSKPALIRKITKALRVMPKKRLAVLCYDIALSKLPRLKIIKKKKAKKETKHKALRYCFKCKRTHSISEHKFHGKGAFKKTHKKRRKR